MYRTNELYELIFQGLPDSLRRELWFIFSGAIHDVNSHSDHSRSVFSLAIERRASQSLSQVSAKIVTGENCSGLDER